jgi:Na+/proline symporter
MFIMLSRVLLWLLLGTLVVSLFQKFYPSATFVGRLILVVIIVIMALFFVNPSDPAAASLWKVVSFPLKPLGAAILLLLFSAQRINKAGGVDKPGGFLTGCAIGILLLASTPAFAYFFGVRLPDAIGSNPVVQDLRLAAATTPQTDLGNYDVAIAPYIAQTPQDIPRRGLRLDDFVPNVDTLQVTTRTWEAYLNQINQFLRPR